MKAAIERPILFEQTHIFFISGGTDTRNFSTGQVRFENIGGIDGSFGATSPDQIMDLINK